MLADDWLAFARLGLRLDFIARLSWPQHRSRLHRVVTHMNDRTSARPPRFQQARDVLLRRRIVALPHPRIVKRLLHIDDNECPILRNLHARTIKEPYRIVILSEDAPTDPHSPDFGDVRADAAPSESKDLLFF